MSSQPGILQFVFPDDEAGETKGGEGGDASQGIVADTIKSPIREMDGAAVKPIAKGLYYEFRFVMREIRIHSIDPDGAISRVVPFTREDFVKEGVQAHLKHGRTSQMTTIDLKMAH